MAAAAQGEDARLQRIVGWLLGDGRRLTDPAAFVQGLVDELLAVGVPVARLSVNLPTLHPELFARGFYWQRGAAVRCEQRRHGITETPSYRNSPIRTLLEHGAPHVRRRLTGPDAQLDYPLMQELREAGLSDYLALPLRFSNGFVVFTTWATDAPQGFAEADVALIEGLLPALTPVVEVLEARHIAGTLLDTYLGHRTGERVLRGRIRRGDYEAIDAVLWYCDLRGFTALTERLDGDALIDLLNTYFERMAAGLEAQGGEILKFIGDAMLAIFARDESRDWPTVCKAALSAARDALAAMHGLNAERAAAGEPRLDFGLALHVGTVMYGNIGTPDRLDFTVIGPSVNHAVRIEGACRMLGVPVLTSDAFARHVPEALRPLGFCLLPGEAGRHELYALDDDEDA
jgi:adenylate cyclase